jgi:hypothetical protein
MHDMHLWCLSVCLSCYQRCLLHGIQKEIHAGIENISLYHPTVLLFELSLYAACLLLELICPFVTTVRHSRLAQTRTSITCLPKATGTCCEQWKNAPKLNRGICRWWSLTDSESGPCIYLYIHPSFMVCSHSVEVSIWSWHKSRHLVSSHYPRSAHPAY